MVTERKCREESHSGSIPPKCARNPKVSVIESRLYLNNIIRLESWQEDVGTLREVKLGEGYCFATIGSTIVLLPFEMEVKLRELLGLRIGVLRTDHDYRVRIIPEARANAGESVQNPT